MNWVNTASKTNNERASVGILNNKKSYKRQEEKQTKQTIRKSDVLFFGSGKSELS